MNPLENDEYRFGSAAFAHEEDIYKAGLFQQHPDSLFFGFFDGKPLFYSGPGGWLLTAGARGGKLSTILGYNLCHSIHVRSMFVLDMKGELGAISEDQTPDKKHCIYWNPCGLHGLPQSRINPVDFIRKDSRTLVSDTKVFCQNFITSSGSANGAYFEGRAREYLEAICLTLVQKNGTLTLPDLYRTVNMIPAGDDAWQEFAFDMKESGIELSDRVQEEIEKGQTDSASSGYQGIMGEIFKSLSCLSDPTLLDAVSPPFDYSLETFADGDQPTQLYAMPPAEFIQPWAPVIKALFAAGMIYKSRKPHAPRQTWILDECAQLGGWPMIQDLFSYGAGIGVRPVAVFQSAFQMDRIGRNARNIITSSAQLRSYFAIRDIETAGYLSGMLGSETLEYDDKAGQAHADFARRRAAQSVLMGGDPFAVGAELKHYKDASVRKTKQARALRTPDEVLNTPADNQYVFLDGLPGAIYAERGPYFEQGFMAGRYHPNPYHPPLDRVSVKTLWGQKWRSVIKEPVPQGFADYPQYRNGTWSRIA